MKARFSDLLLCATGPERVANPYRIDTDTEFWTRDAAANVWESSHPLSSDAVFIAETENQYVGLSFLAQPDATRRIIAQGETAVHVDWRRRGIATLLKLNVIQYALQQGFDEITTRTASPGMRALNEGVGFESKGSEVRLVKKIVSNQ